MYIVGKLKIRYEEMSEMYKLVSYLLKYRQLEIRRANNFCMLLDC